MNGVVSVTRVTNREVAANTYLSATEGSATCLLIDPGLDQEAIQATLTERGLRPSAIYCTHGHFDHLGSADHFSRHYDIPVYLHGADVKVARASNFRMLALKLPSRIVVPETFAALDDATAASDGVSVVPAPGHTPGSVVLRIGAFAFTGDTIYRDDTWRMAWPEEDGELLEASIRRLWLDLPDETIVYPGHGGSATFGAIKQRNVPMRRMLGLDEVVAS